MRLVDKDLLSIQQTRDLVAAAKKAQLWFTGKTQAEVDRLVEAVAEAGIHSAQRLGRLAAEETGFGLPEHKTIKNIFASRSVFEAVKDLKTVGEIGRDEQKGIRQIAVPVGVVAALIPSTNPTSTVLFKAIIALKSGNAIVFSPHPSALHCILETVAVVRKAVADAGADENLVGCISMPTQQATDALMKHRDVSLILATGGGAMVRAAYSSGTPALGVGPGNGPAFIERTADIPLAVKRILDSKTFDNGTICASEQSVICERDMRAVIQAEMERQGAYFLGPDDKDRLGRFILRPNGTMNPRIVGKSVQDIAARAGIHVPQSARVLVVDEDQVGLQYPFSHEKLAPILAFYTEDDYEKVCGRCQEILEFEGAGHTFALHTRDEKIVDYFTRRIPVSRVLVNTPSALGGIGATTNLLPSLTLGCGAVGGSATSENVGPLQLMNIRYAAMGTLELEQLMHAEQTQTESAASVDEELVEAIVKSVIERYQRK